jgi:hypothetical protein
MSRSMFACEFCGELYTKTESGTPFR